MNKRSEAKAQVQKIFVTAKPHARDDQVKQLGENHYLVATRAKPHQGKANRAVLALLSDYLGVPRSRLSLLTGAKSRKKVVAVQLSAHRSSS